MGLEIILMGTDKVILVTGANGFVGTYVCKALIESGYKVRGVVRHKESMLIEQVEKIVVTDIDGTTNWSQALMNVDTVIHLAARVHKMKENSNNPLLEYRTVNSIGTEWLAKNCIKYSVKRFIFISSIKVNGEERNIAYKEDDVPAPKDDYGISKLEAEEALRRIAKISSLETVILRPPLIYGCGVKANFERLIHIVNKGTPLPLGKIKNKRSLLYVDNLVDLILNCITHPNAANKTYLVSDEQDLSTPELVEMIATAMNKKAKIFSLPLIFLKVLGLFTRKTSSIDRLIGNLTIDNSKVFNELSWSPPIKVSEGIYKTIHGQNRVR